MNRICVAWDRFARASLSDRQLGIAAKDDGRFVCPVLDLKLGQTIDGATFYHFEACFIEPIALEQVNFTVFLGQRLGCVPSGRLGFVHGNLIGPVRELALAENEYRRLRFNGHRFVDAAGDRVDHCDHLVLLTDGTALIRIPLPLPAPNPLPRPEPEIDCQAASDGIRVETKYGFRARQSASHALTRGELLEV